MCKETWPLAASKIKAEKSYICSRCSRDKESSRLFSAENDMDPCVVPPKLQGLTELEEMLIARALPTSRRAGFHQQSPRECVWFANFDHPKARLRWETWTCIIYLCSALLLWALPMTNLLSSIQICICKVIFVVSAVKRQNWSTQFSLSVGVAKSRFFKHAFRLGASSYLHNILVSLTGQGNMFPWIDYVLCINIII